MSSQHIPTCAAIDDVNTQSHITIDNVEPEYTITDFRKCHERFAPCTFKTDHTMTVQMVIDNRSYTKTGMGRAPGNKTEAQVYPG